MLCELASTTLYVLTSEDKTVMFRFVRFEEEYAVWAAYETDESGNFMRTCVFDCHRRDSLDNMFEAYSSKKNLSGSNEWEWKDAETTWSNVD